MASPHDEPASLAIAPHAHLATHPHLPAPQAILLPENNDADAFTVAEPKPEILPHDGPHEPEPEIHSDVPPDNEHGEKLHLAVARYELKQFEHILRAQAATAASVDRETHLQISAEIAYNELDPEIPSDPTSNEHNDQQIPFVTGATLRLSPPTRELVAILSSTEEDNEEQS